LVVEKLNGRPAGVNDQGVKAARREREIRALHLGVQMLGIELIETVFAHAGS
jgi:hypothetical protein